MLTVEELSKFTAGELSSSQLTWGDLEKTPKEIYKMLSNDNRPVPKSVIDKLQALCDVLPDEVKNKQPEVSKIKTIGEAIALVNGVLAYIKHLHDIADKAAPIIEAIIDELLKNP